MKVESELARVLEQRTTNKGVATIRCRQLWAAIWRQGWQLLIVRGTCSDNTKYARQASSRIGPSHDWLQLYLIGHVGSYFDHVHDFIKEVICFSSSFAPTLIYQIQVTFVCICSSH